MLVQILYWLHSLNHCYLLRPHRRPLMLYLDACLVWVLLLLLNACTAFQIPFFSIHIPISIGPVLVVFFHVLPNGYYDRVAQESVLNYFSSKHPHPFERLLQPVVYVFRFHFLKPVCDPFPIAMTGLGLLSRKLLHLTYELCAQ